MQREICSGRPIRDAIAVSPSLMVVAAVVGIVVITGNLASAQKHPALEAHSCIPPVDLSTEPLPSGAVARIGLERFKHGSFLVQIAFSPDGQLLAGAGGRD